MSDFGFLEATYPISGPATATLGKPQENKDFGPVDPHSSLLGDPPLNKGPSTETRG